MATVPPGGYIPPYVMFLNWLALDFVHFLCDGAAALAGGVKDRMRTWWLLWHFVRFSTRWRRVKGRKGICSCETCRLKAKGPAVSRASLYFLLTTSSIPSAP